MAKENKIIDEKRDETLTIDALQKDIKTTQGAVKKLIETLKKSDADNDKLCEDVEKILKEETPSLADADLEDNHANLNKVKKDLQNLQGKLDIYEKTQSLIERLRVSQENSAFFKSAEKILKETQSVDAIDKNYDALNIAHDELDKYKKKVDNLQSGVNGVIFSLESLIEDSPFLRKAVEKQIWDAKKVLGKTPSLDDIGDSHDAVEEKLKAENEKLTLCVDIVESLFILRHDYTQWFSSEGDKEKKSLTAKKTSAADQVKALCGTTSSAYDDIVDALYEQQCHLSQNTSSDEKEVAEQENTEEKTTSQEGTWAERTADICADIKVLFSEETDFSKPETFNCTLKLPESFAFTDEAKKRLQGLHDQYSNVQKKFGLYASLEFSHQMLRGRFSALQGSEITKHMLQNPLLIAAQEHITEAARLLGSIPSDPDTQTLFKDTIKKLNENSKKLENVAKVATKLQQLQELYTQKWQPVLAFYQDEKNGADVKEQIDAISTIYDEADRFKRIEKLLETLLNLLECQEQPLDNAFETNIKKCQNDIRNEIDKIIQTEKKINEHIDILRGARSLESDYITNNLSGLWYKVQNASSLLDSKAVDDAGRTLCQATEAAKQLCSEDTDWSSSETFWQTVKLKSAQSHETSGHLTILSSELGCAIAAQELHNECQIVRSIAREDLLKNSSEDTRSDDNTLSKPFEDVQSLCAEANTLLAALPEQRGEIHSIKKACVKLVDKLLSGEDSGVVMRYSGKVDTIGAVTKTAIEMVIEANNQISVLFETRQKKLACNKTDGLSLLARSENQSHDEEKRYKDELAASRALEKNLQLCQDVNEPLIAIVSQHAEVESIRAIKDAFKEILESSLIRNSGASSSYSDVSRIVSTVKNSCVKAVNTAIIRANENLSRLLAQMREKLNLSELKKVIKPIAVQRLEAWQEKQDKIDKQWLKLKKQLSNVSVLAEGFKRGGKLITQIKTQKDDLLKGNNFLTEEGFIRAEQSLQTLQDQLNEEIAALQKYKDTMKPLRLKLRKTIQRINPELKDKTGFQQQYRVCINFAVRIVEVYNHLLGERLFNDDEAFCKQEAVLTFYQFQLTTIIDRIKMIERWLDLKGKPSGGILTNLSPSGDAIFESIDKLSCDVNKSVDLLEQFRSQMVEYQHQLGALIADFKFYQFKIATLQHIVDTAKNSWKNAALSESSLQSKQGNEIIQCMQTVHSEFIEADPVAKKEDFELLFQVKKEALKVYQDRLNEIIFKGLRLAAFPEAKSKPLLTCQWNSAAAKPFTGLSAVDAQDEKQSDKAAGASKAGETAKDVESVCNGQPQNAPEDQVQPKKRTVIGARP